MTQFKVKMKNGSTYTMMADNKSAAERSLKRLGMRYDFIIDVDGDTKAALSALAGVMDLFEGTINYTTGVWQVDLPGEPLTGHMAFLPVRAGVIRHVTLRDGEVLTMTDDGVGRLLATQGK